MSMSLARQEFYKHLPLTHDKPGDPAQAGMEFLITRAGIMMQVWYGLLYVVIEGWEQAGLIDAEIHEMLMDTDKVGKLRAFRNAVFHFSTAVSTHKTRGLIR